MPSLSTSPSQERRFTPFIRALIIFLGYEIITFGFSIGIAAILGNEISDTTQNIMRLVLFVIYIAFIVLLTKKVDRRPLHVLQWRINGNAITWFLIALAITGVIMVVSAVVSNALWPSSLVAPETAGWDTFFSGFVAAFVLQGFPEELAFRGYLSQTVTTTPVKTLSITTILFTVLHWHFVLQYQGLDIIYNLLSPLTFGALAFILMYLHRTVWAAVAVHGGMHISHTTLEILGYADGGLRVLLQSILFALAAAVVFYLNRDAFKPDQNRLVYD